MKIKYTDDELHDASKKVMKSLNWVNSARSQTSLAKPAIRNSLGQAEARISKSSRKRHSRKQKTNLAGKKMEDLLDVLPTAPKPELVPKTLEELKEAQVSAANKKSHHSRKAEQKVVRHEIKSFGTKSMDEIRQNVLKQSLRE